MSGTLPEHCCSILPSTGELIVIKRGERGYYRSEWNTDSREENKNIADFTNSRMGITPAQLEAMVCGSMCGWDVPGAQPQFYLDRASKEKSVAITGHIKHPVLSTYFPVKGHLHTYRIMGTEAYYIDFSSMPKMMMEERLGYTYHPELVTGELMIPVSYQQGQNGSYTLYLGNGSFRNNTEQYKGYTMMASVSMEDREIAVGFHSQDSRQYAVWDWQGKHRPNPAHTSFTEYAEAMKCFETHTTMLYALHRHLRRETHKHKDSTGRER